MSLLPLQLQCTEKLPDETGDLEMYSVRFVMSVARKRSYTKIKQQRNRSHRTGADVLTYPSPDDPLDQYLVQDRHLD